MAFLMGEYIFSIRCRRWFPSFCGRRRGSTRLHEGCGASCKASPERGGAHHRRAEGFAPQRHKGRGGSVSRRDHNQAAGNRTPTHSGILYERKTTSNRSYSSGEGVWGRGASLREAASPPECSPPNIFSGGSAREGPFLQRGPLPRIFYSFLLIKRHTGAFGGHELFFGVGENAVIG